MISSIRCDSRDAQAVPPPSSISMRSAVARPAARRSFRTRSATARTLAADPSPWWASASAARSRRKAAPSISSSSFRGILAICAGWSRFMGGVYSANWAEWVWVAPRRADAWAISLCRLDFSPQRSVPRAWRRSHGAGRFAAWARQSRPDCVSAASPQTGSPSASRTDHATGKRRHRLWHLQLDRRRSSKSGKPKLVPLEDGQVTMPSAVFFNFEDNRTYFGRRAIADYTDNVDGRLLRALKSVLGTSLINDKTRIKTHSIAFSDIIGSFLHNLKELLEEAAGQPVDNIVLGRPVHFVDDDAAGRSPRAERTGKGSGKARFQTCRLPVRAHCRGTRLRAERAQGRTGADHRHWWRHVRFLDRSRLAGARRKPPTARTIFWPAPGCMSAAPTSTGCSASPI